MSNTHKKPLVVVTGPNKRLKVGWWATRLMLWLVGLRGRYVTVLDSQIPQDICGVIIGGGDDIEPVHYGFAGDAGATYDPDRDRLEMMVARRALDKQLPILGICRGSQLLNVVCGGTLFRDIRPLRKKTPNRNTAVPIKWVKVDNASLLKRALGSSRVKVNSLHNQAVDAVGDSLRAVAWDGDGFIQAVEDAQRDFLLGVQWHPEYLPYKAVQRRLFKCFAAAVGRVAERRPTER